MFVVVVYVFCALKVLEPELEPVLNDESIQYSVAPVSDTSEPLSQYTESAHTPMTSPVYSPSAESVYSPMSPPLSPTDPIVTSPEYGYVSSTSFGGSSPWYSDGYTPVSPPYYSTAPKSPPLNSDAAYSVDDKADDDKTTE